ncbi:CLUMA_CG015667, isoform A [Clunio marinus]|uniref:CLUMA_CG015667, isoform A n=1 Tax=Clunio marinus TaxID=568069 RepID=A0A1J1IP63_9DIPT|nr:CLUMA_CG015667, isoform A [Clunio marinus]
MKIDCRCNNVFLFCKHHEIATGRPISSNIFALFENMLRGEEKRKERNFHFDSFEQFRKTVKLHVGFVMEINCA